MEVLEMLITVRFELSVDVADYLMLPVETLSDSAKTACTLKQPHIIANFLLHSSGSDSLCPLTAGTRKGTHNYWTLLWCFTLVIKF